MSEPESAKQLFYYKHKADGIIVASTNTATVPGVTFDSGANGGAEQALYHRNSFHWDRKQFANLSFSLGNPGQVGSLSGADFRKARMQHWLLDADGISITETLSSTRDSSPDPGGQAEGGWTWFGYGNSTPADTEATSQVTATARLLPDGTSQYTSYKYFTLPPLDPLPWVSENHQSYTKTDGSVGELTNTFTYTNGCDLIVQSNSIGQYSKIAYNASHEVTFVTNALNQVTSFGYSGTTLTSVSMRSGKTISFGYNSSSPVTTTNSFLNQITIQPENLVENITDWTYGLPRAVHVSGAGMPDLYMTNYWDKLNRLTGTLFPDNTTISNVYLSLDLIAEKDRVGNWTKYTFDGLRHLAGLTNALNNVTTFTWCGCGSLTSITDPMTNVTYFNLNNQELLTNVIFGDGSSYTDNYDLVGRLVSRTDGANKTIQFGYNNEDLVTNISGAYGQVLGVTYDAVGRPTSTTYITGVVANDSFDLLNELTNRSWAGGGTERFLYASNGLIAYTNQDNQGTLFAGMRPEGS